MNYFDYLAYDGSSGELYHKPRIGDARFNGRFAGKVAGRKALLQNGKRKSVDVCVGFSRLKAHRIIWEMHHGAIPDGVVVDHINGDPWDNRLSNLRLATIAQNAHNARKRVKTSSSRLKGVSFWRRQNKWVAQIFGRERRIYLGSFDTEQEAHEAYCAAAHKHCGQFARTL